MKVVAFNGSPRKNGNTSILIKTVFNELEKEGIKTELVWLGNEPLQGCTGCFKCQKNLDRQCALKNDSMNKYLQKIVIFGNSGSGKSTLAKELSAKFNLPHLDLDTLAWNKHSPTTRRKITESKKEIDKFIRQNDVWIIEGCYTDLLELVTSFSNKIIFLNPGHDTCIANCKKRPWEPHKYKSLEEQNKNLQMLINWIKQYSIRKDEFSLKAHRNLFDDFEGYKVEYKSNKQLKQDHFIEPASHRPMNPTQ